MNTIVVTSTKQNIKFGYEGEDNVTKIVFPYDESWLEYGEGNFEVRILRCGDEVAYTATDVVDDRQAMTLTMTVTDIELSVRGRGEMQLCYVCPDSIKKSPIYQYTVNRSVDYKYAVDPPEGSIIASVEKSLSEIKNTTNRLSNSVISIESSIDDVNSQIDNINDKISEFDEEIDSIGEVETRVDNLETSIQSINGRINTAEGNINENTESISDLNESVTELENRKVTDLETSGGKSDSGKYLTVGTDGKIKATSLTIPPTITVDASLSTTSTNPVQNKVIKTELNNINSNIETCNTEISKINGSLENKADLPITSKNIEVTWDAEHDGNYIDGNGNIGISELFHISDLIEVDASSVYVLDFTYPESAIAATRIHAYDSEGAWISQVAYRLNSYRNIISFITDSKTRYIRVSVRKTATVNYFRRALESAYCFDASYTVTMKDGATYLVDPAENSVTITSNKSSKYQSANTMTDFARVKLEAGSLYEWHYKANVVSGSPTILMALRDSNDSIVVSLSGSDGKESSGYFIAKKEMKYLSLFCSFSTAVTATVKYSDVWIKKVESGKEKINLIRQSKYGDSNSILQIVHFSDIHGDTVAMDAITEFLNKYHVDDVINTGDICYFTYGYGELVDDEIVTVKEYDTSKSYNIDDVCIYNNLLYVCTTATSGDFTSSHWRKVNTDVSAWSLSSKDLYLNHPIAERALTVLGNHETLLYVYNKATGNVSATNNWYVLNRQEAYETFFEPFIPGWGVTHQSQRLYWHKDYASVGIRIIGIDMQYWDAEEESWLDTVLAEAQSLGYKVILLSHYILGQFTGNPDVTFQYNTTDDQIYTGNYKSSSSGYYGAYRNGDAISTLVNYRDIIICNLCGHMHADYYGYTKLDDTDGRQLLTIGIDQAGILREVSGADRSAADTRYVFNLFTVDTSTKVLKIVRFGNDTDKYLRSKKTLCVRYETGKILANN